MSLGENIHDNAHLFIFVFVALVSLAGLVLLSNDTSDGTGNSVRESQSLCTPQRPVLIKEDPTLRDDVMDCKKPVLGPQPRAFTLNWYCCKQA